MAIGNILKLFLWFFLLLTPIFEILIYFNVCWEPNIGIYDAIPNSATFIGYQIKTFIDILGPINQFIVIFAFIVPILAFVEASLNKDVKLKNASLIFLILNVLMLISFLPLLGRINFNSGGGACVNPIIF